MDDVKVESPNVVDDHAENTAERVVSFEDALGRTWTPVVTTPTLLRTCRSCRIKLRDITSLDIEVAALFDLLWFACERQAKERHVSYEDFVEALTLDKLPTVVDATIGAIMASFPDKEEGGTVDPHMLGSGLLRNWLGS